MSVYKNKETQKRLLSMQKTYSVAYSNQQEMKKKDVDVMEKVFPGYLIQHGYFSKNAYFFDYKILPGKLLVKYLTAR